MIEDIFTSCYIYINTIQKVKDFVQDVNKINADVDLVVGHYICDAKSILACFSVDLSKPIRCIIHSDESEELIKFKQICNKYKADNKDGNY